MLKGVHCEQYIIVLLLVKDICYRITVSGVMHYLCNELHYIITFVETK